MSPGGYSRTGTSASPMTSPPAASTISALRRVLGSTPPPRSTPHLCQREASAPRHGCAARLESSSPQVGEATAGLHARFLIALPLAATCSERRPLHADVRGAQAGARRARRGA